MRQESLESSQRSRSSFGGKAADFSKIILQLASCDDIVTAICVITGRGVCEQVIRQQNCHMASRWYGDGAGCFVRDLGSVQPHGGG